MSPNVHSLSQWICWVFTCFFSNFIMNKYIYIYLHVCEQETQKMSLCVRKKRQFVSVWLSPEKSRLHHFLSLVYLCKFYSALVHCTLTEHQSQDWGKAKGRWGQWGGGRLSSLLSQVTRRGMEVGRGKERVITAWTNVEQRPEFRASPSWTGLTVICFSSKYLDVVTAFGCKSIQ